MVNNFQTFTKMFKTAVVGIYDFKFIHRNKNFRFLRPMKVYIFNTGVIIIVGTSILKSRIFIEIFDIIITKLFNNLFKSSKNMYA